MGSIRRTRGFTLVEMVVSIAIVTLIALVVLTSHSAFSNSLIVSNTAYDVALSLRNAQSYGIGSRGVGSVVNTGYGLDFTSASPSSYTFFADTYPAASCTTPDCKAGDGIYTPAQDLLVSTYTINNGISIAGFCGYIGASSYCTTNGSADTLDIVFTRPNTAAQISAKKSGTTYGALGSACIALASQGGVRKYVSVSSIGEIDRPSSCTNL